MEYNFKTNRTMVGYEDGRWTELVQDCAQWRGGYSVSDDEEPGCPAATVFIHFKT